MLGRGPGPERCACIVYSTGGDPFTSCDPSFAGDCGAECECVLAMHRECTGCAVVGGGVRAECSI